MNQESPLPLDQFRVHNYHWISLECRLCLGRRVEGNVLEQELEYELIWIYIVGFQIVKQQEHVWTDQTLVDFWTEEETYSSLKRSRNFFYFLTKAQNVIAMERRIL